ncbi:hypothetical protein ACFSR7_06010 [Cohnella sp. GCM10020058]|uniref:hypothetical protein n=1 Tax=Cohnella sp. GCM10020058 TaxID=3317330 RepID=UPI00363D314C
MLDAFLKQLLNLPDTQKNDVLSLCHEILQNEKLRNIAKSVSLVTDDAEVPQFTKDSTLDRIGRYIVSARAQSKLDATTRQYVPPMNKFAIVKVNFAGLGSELDDLHFGIVWDVERKRDHISIIPTTSYKPGTTRENGTTFNLGNISYLPNQTVVMMHQITSVSRKRIQSHRHYNDATGRSGVVYLSPDQRQRVYEGFRVYGLNEETLYNKHIRNSYSDTLPIFEDPEAQFDHLHRPIIDVSNTKDELVYKLYSDLNTEYKIIRKGTGIQTAERDLLLRNLVNATAQVDATGAIMQSRLDVRMAAYTSLLSKIIQEPKDPASAG